jgi:hypothetical protein
MAKKTLLFDIPAIIRGMDEDAKVRRAFLSVTAKDSVRKDIGQRIIEQIIQNTQSGKDKDFENFTPNVYSKAYQKSAVYKLYGKKKSPVNMTLTGDMLLSIVVKSAGNVVKIGFNSEKEFLKASGHIDGTGANNALPVRDFWGLPLDQVEKIIKLVIKDKNEDTLNEIIDDIETETKVSTDRPGTEVNVSINTRVR